MKKGDVGSQSNLLEKRSQKVKKKCLKSEDKFKRFSNRKGAKYAKVLKGKKITVVHLFARDTSFAVQVLLCALCVSAVNKGDVGSQNSSYESGIPLLKIFTKSYDIVGRDYSILHIKYKESY